MEIRPTDIARLSLLIARILDAEVLPEAEGASLRTETEAARRSLEAGDAEGASQHIEQVALFTEALMHTDRLDPSDGRAVLETARRLLTKDFD